MGDDGALKPDLGNNSRLMALSTPADDAVAGRARKADRATAERRRARREICGGGCERPQRGVRVATGREGMCGRGDVGRKAMVDCLPRENSGMRVGRG